MVVCLCGYIIFNYCIVLGLMIVYLFDGMGKLRFRSDGIKVFIDFRVLGIIGKVFKEEVIIRS